MAESRALRRGQDLGPSAASPPTEAPRASKPRIPPPPRRAPWALCPAAAPVPSPAAQEGREANSSPGLCTFPWVGPGCRQLCPVGAEHPAPGS